MKVYESIDIAAPPAAVWAQLVDPQRMAAWHAKLLEVRRKGVGPVRSGDRFGATYTMSVKRRKLQQTDTEVLRCEPRTTLALRHQVHDKGQIGFIDETYELQPREGGRETHVVQTVDFAGAGMPWWARALIWCISRTGEPRGEGILEPLKRVCEGESPQSVHVG